METRVLVLGSAGMLGQEIFTYLSTQPSLKVLGTYHKAALTNVSARDLERLTKFEVDFSYAQLSRVLSDVDVVVNTIAILKSDIDESSPIGITRAFDVNALFPRFLSEVAAQHDVSVIHISTDGVFPEDSLGSLTERTPPAPTDIYGKSKLLGETSAANVVNLRTSIIGRNPNYQRGLLEWFLKQPPESSITGYSDIWNGATTRQVAQLISLLLDKGVFQELRAESQVHHFCPNYPIPKSDLLAIFSKMSDKRVTIAHATNPNGKITRTLSSCLEKLKKVWKYKDNDDHPDTMSLERAIGQLF